MHKSHLWPLTLVGASLAAGAACKKSEPSASHPEKTETAAASIAAEIGRSAEKSGNWMLHGRTYSEQRFSPLTQITKENVKDLGLSWFYDIETRRGMEATPILIDGKLFLTSAWSIVHAFDAKTGKLLWKYDPEVPGEWGAKGCCDVVNRGVAYWEGKIYVGSFDGRLIALDADSGKKVWETDTLIDRTKSYTITGAPRVVKGRVLIGNGGAEFGVRGYVSAYDAQTGKLDWRFYTVPGDPSKPFENPILEEAAKTWTGEWWKVGGGGTVWDSMAYDPDLDLLYIGVGNGSPWDPRIRSPEGGDNLFLSSIVALRPDTGEYVWHYQTTPGDQWDYTATQHMILADLEIEGETRQVLMQAPKNGFFYVLDRKTGELISAENYAPMTWAKGVDMKTGRPNIVPEARYDRFDGVWGGMPGALGAHSWHPMSFNPKTGLVYITTQIMGFPYLEEKPFEMEPLGVNLGVDLSAAEPPADPKVVDQFRKTLTGELLAWDPVKQKEVWRKTIGGPGNGGVVSTASGLVFQGNKQGFLAAYDATDGEQLWNYPVQTGVIAPPISYEIDGKQYVTVVAGWGGVIPLLMGGLSHNDDGPQVNRSRVLVFELGGEKELPEPYDVARPSAPPPKAFGTKAELAHGEKLFARYCGTCHGGGAVSGGIVPDLRKSPVLGTEEAWFAITYDGKLKDNGMVSFKDVLSKKDLSDIRAYVVQRAHASLGGKTASL